MSDGTRPRLGRPSTATATGDHHHEQQPRRRQRRCSAADVVQLASGDGGWRLGAQGRRLACWSCGRVRLPCSAAAGSITTNEQRAPRGRSRPAARRRRRRRRWAWRSAAALTEDGTVWIWGRNLNNTLDVHRRCRPAGSQLTPSKVPLPAGPPVVDIEMDYAATTVRHAGRRLGAGVGRQRQRRGGQRRHRRTTSPAPPADRPRGRPGHRGHRSSVWNGLALVRAGRRPGRGSGPLQYVTARWPTRRSTRRTGGSATLTLSEAAPDDLTVTYTVGDGPERTATVRQGCARPRSCRSPSRTTQLDEDDEQLPLQVVSISHGVRVDGGSAVVTVRRRRRGADPVGRLRRGRRGRDEPHRRTGDGDALGAVSGKDVEVLWTTADGSAVAPGDYTEASGHVLVPAGATSADRARRGQR